MKPFGFFDYNRLQKGAACVLSDSGTITEESSLLGFPAVTIRTAMERPEGLDTGCIVLTGLDSAVILSAVDAVMQQRRSGAIGVIPEDYRIDNVAQRVVNLIIGTAHLSNSWDGIVDNTSA
jgi:UDP-N-acetylglucosamine 2-epimerase (non-hydrolysing)